MNLQELKQPSVTVRIVGHVWQPGFGLCAYHYNPPAGAVGTFTREGVRKWLDRNAGDFSSVEDFEAEVTWYETEPCASCGQPVRRTATIPWEREESEIAYLDAMEGTA